MTLSESDRDLSPASYGDLARSYRKLLAKVPPAPYKHIRVLHEHFLHADGHVRRSVGVQVEALADNVDLYQWRVPVPAAESKVTGLAVLSNPRVHGFSTRREENLYTIEISLTPLAKGERTYLHFDYFVTHACELTRRRLVFSEYRYPFAYKPTSSTEAFEFRLHSPLAARLDIRSNLPRPEIFRLGTDQLVIASEEPFDAGDIVGEVQVRFRTAAYVPLISLALGSLSTVLVAVVKYGDNWIGAWHLLFVPVVLALIFLIGLYAYGVD